MKAVWHPLAKTASGKYSNRLGGGYRRDKQKKFVKIFFMMRYVYKNLKLFGMVGMCKPDKGYRGIAIRPFTVSNRQVIDAPESRGVWPCRHHFRTRPLSVKC